MKQTRSLMGMHVTIEIVDPEVTKHDIVEIYDYFTAIDERFSTYKPTSEISHINAGIVQSSDYSEDMKKILALCEQTKLETKGYFDSYHNGKLDPSGIVKGWAILEASNMIKKKGFRNFYVDAGGDMQVSGNTSEGKPWTVGIRNPFNRQEIVKVVALEDRGIATSGTSIRGQHIYNPHRPQDTIYDILSMTVIGKNVYEADRFATAAFAMGIDGARFIETISGLEAYMIDAKGLATYTSGFNRFVVS